MEENYNENKKSKKGIVFIIALVLGLLIGIGGSYYYFVVMNSNNDESVQIVNGKKISSVEITSDQEENMTMIAERIFKNGENSLKFNDLNNQEKLRVAMSLLDDNYDFTKLKGEDLVKAVKKYFGNRASIKLEDINCHLNHTGAGESNVMYIYNKDTDMYNYNPEHDGHGGGGGDRVAKHVKNKITIKNGKYYLQTGIYYTKFDCAQYDTCGPAKDAGYIYKNNDDAENNRNMIFDASKDQKLYYFSDAAGDEYNYNWDLIEKEIQDKLDTYTFVFEKKGNRLIFKEYKKD